MKSENEAFTPETVDEQVEQLSRSLYALPSRQSRTADAQLVQNLYRMYELEQEDARSVARGRHRLEEQGWLAPERQRLSRLPGRRAPAPGAQEPARRLPPTPRRRGWLAPLTMVAAVLMVMTLIGGLVVGLVLVRQGKGGVAVQPSAQPSVYGISNSAVVALNLADGKVRWQHAFTYQPSQPASLVEADDALYVLEAVNSVTHTLIVLNKNDGSVLWQQQGIFEIWATKGLVLLLSFPGNTLTFSAYVPQTGKKLWAFAPQRASQGTTLGLGALTDDTIYVETEDAKFNSNDTNHYFLYALDRANGHLRWTFQNPFYMRNITAAGDTVYVGQNTPVTGGNLPVDLIALNASDGKERWHVNDPVDNSTQLGIPVGANGVVYVAVLTDSGGDGPPGPAPMAQPLEAFRASDGQELWHTRPAQAGYSFSQPVVANGVVYTTDTQYAYAFNATNGSLLWQKQFGQVEYPVTPTVQGTRVYVGWGAQAGFGLLALDTGDGHEIWRYSQPPPSTEPLMLYPGPRDGELLDGVIFFHNASFDLVALNATTGQQLWQSSLFQPIT